MNITEEQLNAISTWASADPTIRSVQLFGSRVRGTARPDSDLDVAIDVGDEDDAYREWIIRKSAWEEDLRRITGLLVNVDLYHPSVRVWSYVAECGYEAYRRPW